MKKASNIRNQYFPEKLFERITPIENTLQLKYGIILDTQIGKI